MMAARHPAASSNQNADICVSTFPFVVNARALARNRTPEMPTVAKSQAGPHRPRLTVADLPRPDRAGSVGGRLQKTEDWKSKGVASKIKGNSLPGWLPEGSADTSTPTHGWTAQRNERWSPPLVAQRESRPAAVQLDPWRAAPATRARRASSRGLSGWRPGRAARAGGPVARVASGIAPGSRRSATLPASRPRSFFLFLAFFLFFRLFRFSPLSGL